MGKKSRLRLGVVELETAIGLVDTLLACIGRRLRVDLRLSEPFGRWGRNKASMSYCHQVCAARKTTKHSTPAFSQCAHLGFSVSQLNVQAGKTFTAPSACLSINETRKRGGKRGKFTCNDGILDKTLFSVR